MPTLSLGSDDARLVYLATVYHLGRPGSELDARTLERHTLGLASVQAALALPIEAAVELELSDYQLARLGQALHGVANELKQYEMAERRSAVAGFSETMRRLFPAADGTPGAALDLAQDVVLLRRRLDRAMRDAEANVEAAREEARTATPPRRPWWKLWRR